MGAISKQLSVYKLVIVYILLFSFNSLCTAVDAAMLNNNWADMTTTVKFLTIIVVLQNWTGVLLAFFNKSLSQAEAGQFPIDTTNGGGTKSTVTAPAATVTIETKPAVKTEDRD